ncbi:hypothetical protein ACFP1Z_17645 [Streptomyces gamaensis]|uniref:HEAT repeat domain-containing protein n=1 Tax=Streptomyces gamaensis TaxID=1763542 RepID=A0ABW0YZH1_9ACTN
MTRFCELLGTDFDGEPTDDVDDVIFGAFDDPAHRDRVPGLTALMNDPAVPESERFLACLALTTWGEQAGYEAVIRAAADPKRSPWYETLIDRKFSVDSTFTQLAEAASDKDLAEEKGTLPLRTEALRALVRIADTEYFEGKLGELFDCAVLVELIDDIREVVERGVRSLEAGERHLFDLPTQLVDLATAVAMADGRLGAGLAESVLNVAPSRRALLHAVAVVHRAKGVEGQRFAAYLVAAGGEEVRSRVREALGE